MSRYEVDAAQLAQTATAVNARGATISSEVAAMHRQLAELQGVWRGAASTAFAAVVADWTATQARVEQSLAQIAAAMQTASQAYTEAEAAASRLFVR